jgi:hypothetical protein
LKKQDDKLKIIYIKIKKKDNKFKKLYKKTLFLSIKIKNQNENIKK